MPKNLKNQKIQELINISPYLKKIFESPFNKWSNIFTTPWIVRYFLKREEETKYTIGNYLIKRTLGQGTFGKVKLGIYLPNKEKVAVKILEKEKIIEKMTR